MIAHDFVTHYLHIKWEHGGLSGGTTKILTVLTLLCNPDIIISILIGHP